VDPINVQQHHKLHTDPQSPCIHTIKVQIIC